MCLSYVCVCTPVMCGECPLHSTSHTFVLFSWTILCLHTQHLRDNMYPHNTICTLPLQQYCIPSIPPLQQCFTVNATITTDSGTARVWVCQHHQRFGCVSHPHAPGTGDGVCCWWQLDNLCGRQVCIMVMVCNHGDDVQGYGWWCAMVCKGMGIWCESMHLICVVHARHCIVLWHYSMMLGIAVLYGTLLHYSW